MVGGRDAVVSLPLQLLIRCVCVSEIKCKMVETHNPFRHEVTNSDRWVFKGTRAPCATHNSTFEVTKFHPSTPSFLLSSPENPRN